jgi:hypothetical protein
MKVVPILNTDLEVLMEQKIVFEPIRTKLKPGAYFRDLQERMEFDRYEKVKAGEMVEILLPANRQFTLTYVGVKPEKFDVFSGILKVEMTRSVLIFTRKIHDCDLNCEVAWMEVINAL